MRKPEPWYWAARKAWYVQLDKRQIKLGDDDDPKPRGRPKPPLAVMRQYYRVMGAGGKLDATDRAEATVAEVCEMFLESKSQMRDGTTKLYAFLAKKLAEPCAGRRFRALRKEDILRIAEAQTWGPTMKHKFVGLVASIFGFARDAGYIELNPLAGWENPYRPLTRDRGLTDAEFSAIVDESRDIEFKQVMMFLRGTGCRPGEAGVIEARHVHPDRPLITLEAALHKTGRVTGKVRVLVMPADVAVTIRILAARYPTGPLLRNARNGKGWNRYSLWTRFQRYCKRLGLPRDCTPHMIRHATATRLLDQGTPDHLVAKMIGHAGTSTLQSTYYHPDVALMAAAADKAHERKKP